MLKEQVNEVLDLARIESGRIELSLDAVPLSSVVAECVALVRPLAEARDVRIDAAIDDSVLQADPTRLKQVILNLLSNAIKYNREHGTVHLASTREGERLRFAVTDSGRGIASEHLPRLFQPFERLESSYEGIEGSGVGLALSKRLVEMMAGSIRVDSRIGVGSTFSFDLPLVRVPAATAAAEAGNTGMPPPVAAGTATLATAGRKRRRVLHIEDNPANLKLVRKLLGGRSDVELVDAGSGEVGLALACATTPDLVLLDINLAGQDGFATLRWLRANAPTAAVPVIAVTSDSDTLRRNVDHGEGAGFAEYLSKPLDVRRFQEVVGRFLGSQPDEAAEADLRTTGAAAVAERPA